MWPRSGWRQTASPQTFVVHPVVAIFHKLNLSVIPAKRGHFTAVLWRVSGFPLTFNKGPLKSKQSAQPHPPPRNKMRNFLLVTTTCLFITSPRKTQIWYLAGYEGFSVISASPRGYLCWPRADLNKSWGRNVELFNKANSGRPRKKRGNNELDPRRGNAMNNSAVRPETYAVFPLKICFPRYYWLRG